MQCSIELVEGMPNKIAFTACANQLTDQTVYIIPYIPSTKVVHDSTHYAKLTWKWKRDLISVQLLYTLNELKIPL